ncbi:CHAT domain-containing protein [Leptolyngbya cf. ectocarpi LEGE 11479]|uniref:CHAT domain-containing protein n=1 Tax=Leptolyngbya cf. ectocarpi LEGE 11479 TaxID=1828722 RepID=A0A928ZV25_LEPEC|nr:CHAT domain-containing protein [Leptolyngbya ectocarpi]MBE9067981.1 CHAT domain-containing protein [Leptolyngbya cf. ectocarpi LEGE 11479]
MRRPRLRSSIHRVCVVLCALSLFITLWLGHPFTRSAPIAQAIDARQLVQTGVDYYNTGNYLAAVDPWLSARQAYEASQDLPALAIVDENLARVHQQMGRTSEEITYWEQAIATVRTIGDHQKLGRLLTEQAQAYGRLGQHRRAITLLCGAPDEGSCHVGSALEIAKTTDDSLGQITALGSLGEAYRASGSIKVAQDYLMQGHALSRELGETVLEASLLNSLGNTSTSLALISYRRADEADQRGDFEADNLRTEADTLNAQAIEQFQNSYQLAVEQQDSGTVLYALLNLIPAYERVGNTGEVRRYRELALVALQQLPESKAKAFAAIQLADLLDPLNIRQSQLILSQTPPSGRVERETTALLEQALAIGQATQNFRIQSFALGKLGSLDERAGRYGAAIDKTQRARLAADQDRAAQDSLYLWEWQLGRIYKAQGKTDKANRAYGQAVALLEQIRSDILSANRDLQFDFRDTVEPIYRQYTALNLVAVPKQVTLTEEEAAFDDLELALTTLDSLKVAELQSYFANDCVIVPAQVRADAVGQSSATAVFSTALPDGEEQQSLSKASSVLDESPLTVILSLPSGARKMVQIPVPAEVVNTTINDFRISLELGERNPRFNFDEAQQLYDWLIRPFEADLADVKTLVFVNDGLLRSVPMAALHDGHQFLIEKFAVATTPSLKLTTPEKLKRRGLRALLLGVSELSVVSPERVFDSLPAVEKELALLADKLPATKTLLNDDFSIDTLQTALKETDYRILHMATHGTFGFAPEDNFVIVGAKDETGQYNETLTISELDQLIRNVNDPTREPIELLTLTACETAIGGNRSTLGLAGVAIRAGVRSAVASLWSVSDESTAEIIANFYDQLQQPNLTKAEALQQAQIAMLRSGDSGDFFKAHPYRWAPFILIGNWL